MNALQMFSWFGTKVCSRWYGRQAIWKWTTKFLLLDANRNEKYRMTIETKLDFKRYLNLMYTLTYRKPISIFMTITGLIMFSGSILYFLGFKMPFDEPPYFQIAFGFFIIAILPFSIYRVGRKNFSSHGRLQEKLNWSEKPLIQKWIGRKYIRYWN